MIDMTARQIANKRFYETVRKKNTDFLKLKSFLAQLFLLFNRAKKKYPRRALYEGKKKKRREKIGLINPE